MNHRNTVEWLLVTVLCAALAAVATAFGWLWRIDQVAYDVAMAMHRPTVDDSVVIIAIDDASLAEIGRWPWRRSVHAALIERLDRAGARVIALDVILAEENPERPEADRVLGEAIAASGRVVLPLVQAAQGARIVSEVPPAPPFAAGAAAVGHIHTELDPDGIARSVYLWAGFGAARHPHFALAALQLADPARAAAYHAPASADGGALWHRAHWLRIPFAGPPGSYRAVSYADVLRGDVDEAVFRDKVVFVGATAIGMADSVPTPTSGLNRPMSGVEVNANVYSALVRGDAVTALPAWQAAALAALAVAAVMLAQRRSAARSALLYAFAAAAGTLAGAWIALHGARLWFPPAGALLGFFLCYPLWSWRRLEAAQRQLDDQLEILEGDAERLLPAAPRRSGRPRGLDPLQARIDRVGEAVRRQRDWRRFMVETLESLPVGAVVCDAARRVTLCNRQAMALLDARESAAVARALAALDWPPGVALDGGLPVPAAQGQPLSVELDAPGGARLLVSVAGLASEAGERLGIVLGLADITRIHEAQRGREETMHYLSHDLRSPLASILTLIDAERGATDAEPAHHEFLRQLGRYARSALKLADDLFRLVRAEAVDARSFAEVDLAAVAQEAADEVWALARAKSVQVAVHAEDEAGCYVRGDRELLRRALVNLLGNAVKYGPANSEVAVSVMREGKRWAVAVRDRGEGIREDLLPCLFRRFGRLPTAASRREPGIGLGLMIVKTVAERHGGQVSVDSRPGAGCTFTLHLPALP